jgi:uncharacterized membrane protein (UPF0127 family)
MKKIFLVVVLIIGIAYFFLPVCAPSFKDSCISIPRWKLLLDTKTKTIKYTLNNKQYNLLIAASPQEWKKGLMYYRKLNGVDGMIFFFPDKQIRSFWNKNTFMELDVYWLNDKVVIGKSYLPSIEKSKNIIIVTSPDKANVVIELQMEK